MKNNIKAIFLGLLGLLNTSVIADEDENNNNDDQKSTITALSVASLIKSAEQIQDAQPDKAYEIYKQAVTIIDGAIAKGEQPEQSEYDVLYATELYARKVLENNDASFMNSAKNLFKSKETEQQELNQAITFIDVGFKYGFGMDDNHPYREEDDFHHIWETKVALLSKLGRTKEAYKIVAQMQEYDSEPYEYKAILAISEIADYQQWFNNRAITLNDIERDFLTKSERILNNIPTSVIPKDKDIDTSNKNVRYEAVSLTEAMKKYDFIGVSYGENPKTLIIRGDYYSNELIDEDWVKTQAQKFGGDDSQNIEGVLFMNNLYVDSSIEDNESLLLQVQGNVYVEDMVYSSDGIIRFKSDAHIRLGIDGHYNGGSIDVNGKLYTPYLIAHDHSMRRSADQESIYIEGGFGTDKHSVEIGKAENGNTGWGWTYYKGSYRLLNKAVWNEEQEFDTNSFFNLVRTGVNPFISEKDLSTSKQ